MLRGRRTESRPVSSSNRETIGEKLVKVKGNAYSQLASLLRELTGHHGITQCYLPPGRGDIRAFTPANYSWYSI